MAISRNKVVSLLIILTITHTLTWPIIRSRSAQKRVTPTHQDVYSLREETAGWHLLELRRQ